MLREIVHFVRNAPAVMKMQRQHGKAELLDVMTARCSATTATRSTSRRSSPTPTSARSQLEELDAFQRFDTFMPAFPMQRIHAHRRG